MPSFPASKVRRHKNALVTVRASRQPKKHYDPDELSTPTWTESSVTGSETASEVDETDYSVDTSPSLTATSASSIRTASTDSGYEVPMPHIPDLNLEVNPFLLPPGGYPSPPPDLMYSPLDAYLMEAQALQEQNMQKRMMAEMEQLHPPKTMPRPKKKGESRVIFSDEDSVISASTSDTSETGSDGSETETERTPRPKQRDSGHTRAKSTSKATHSQPKSKGKTSARSTSVPSKVNALQVRRRKPTESPKPSSKRIPSKAARDDASNDGDDLMSRISSAIPDLHLLLTKYKDTHGELSLKDQLRKRIEAQQAEMMRTKDETIQSLMGQLEEAAREHANEVSHLRDAIEDLENREAELRRRCAEAEEKAAAAELKLKVVEESESRLTKMNEQQIIENRDLTKRAAEEKATIIKRAAEDKEKAILKQRGQMMDEFKKQTHDIRAKIDKDINGLSKRLDSERESFKSKMKEKEDAHNKAMKKQKDEHEAALKTLKEEHEAAVSKLKDDHDAAISKQKEELEISASKDKEAVSTQLTEATSKLDLLGHTEIEVNARIEAKWNEEKEKLNKEHEDELETLRSHHREYCNEQMRGFVGLQEMLNKALIEENDSLKRLLGKGQLDANPPAPSVEDEKKD